MSVGVSGYDEIQVMVVKIQDHQKKRKKDREREFEALSGLYFKDIFTKIENGKHGTEAHEPISKSSANDSGLISCVFLGFYPLLPDSLICCHIIVSSSLL